MYMYSLKRICNIIHTLSYTNSILFFLGFIRVFMNLNKNTKLKFSIRTVNSLGERRNYLRILNLHCKHIKHFK